MLEIYFSENKKSESVWENSSLEDYLSGMFGFTNDIEGFYKNKKENVDLNNPTWKVFAQILMAASVYE